MRLLNNLPIRYKLIIACSLMFVPFAILAGFFANALLHDTMKEQISRELKNSTATILNMVKVSVHLTIRNSLRNTSEKNTDIIRMFYQDVLDGKLSEEDAKKQAAKVLLSQKIAISGYLYCLDSSGTLVVHPESLLVGKNLAGISFVDEQIRLKNGYSEYVWKGPDEFNSRPRATWMTYFEPWDWIVSASAFRDEFDRIVNIDDFRMSIESLKFLQGGFSYVLDTSGNFIIHPTFEGRNVYAQGVNMPEGLFSKMLVQERGEIVYKWLNPGESDPREKIVVFDTIPEVKWIVASSAYLDDIYQPLKTIRDIALLVSVFCLFGGILIAMQISSSITRPVKVLINYLARGANGDYGARMDYRGRDEIGQLSRYYNLFMERLSAEIKEREKLERQVIEEDDRERLNIGQDLHDDLAPHLIAIEMMCQTLSRQLEGNCPSAVGQAEAIRSLVADATLKTRALARGLCPIHRVDEGLEAALKELVGTVQTFYSVKCQLHGSGGAAVRGAVAVHIYRIIQEAVYNAVKHGEPTEVSVALAHEDDFFIVEIRDNGKGLPELDSAGDVGMGMRIMKFRARMIEADLEVESSKDLGTTVRLRLPVDS